VRRGHQRGRRTQQIATREAHGATIPRQS
jgi:hypothetical protein